MTKRENLYNLEKENLILRDFLAVDRTVLANERTFLAYFRTALTLIVTGSSFIKFVDDVIIKCFGYIFVPLGFLILMMGIYRFLEIRKKLSKIRY